MRNILLDEVVRDRVIRIAVLTLAAVTVTGWALGALQPGLLQTLVLLALIASVAAGGAAMSMLVQQHLLGKPLELAPLPIARWGGALIAAVLGPLVTAGAALALFTAIGTLLLPAEGGGSMAGVGVAWLVLPMAGLITGTASLRTVAVATGHPLEVRDLISMADGHEWSLVPVGMALALAVVLCTAGILGLALGMVPASLGILAGLLVLLPASAALARRWERLAAER